MKNPNTFTPKLLSKREFSHRQAELQEKHAWLLKDKPLDICPGWLHILDTTLLKIKSILTKEDIEQSRLDFLYSSTHGHLRVFFDGKLISQARFKAVEHMIDEAMHVSEATCAKCGCSINRYIFQRNSAVCEEHREFDGDFVEDHRRFLAQMRAETKAEAKAIKEREQVEAQKNAAKLEVIEEAAEEAQSYLRIDPALPTLKVYDVEDVERVLKSIKTRSADSDSRNRLKAIGEEMIKRGGDRPYCPLPDLAVFDDLVQRYPNLQETIQTVRSSVALAKLGDNKLEIPPLLLIGPPGIGKTDVVHKVAAIFETKYVEIHMESEQTGSTITGSSEFWGNTQTGLIFDALAKGDTANPIVLLDEIDKVRGDSRYDPIAGLYSLLERETAKRFEDLSIKGLPIDASSIIWVITANNMSNIPAPIVSRCLVQHIRMLTLDESIVIAQNIYAAIRNTRAWGIHFPPDVQSSVLEELAVHEPRRMKAMLIYAFGKAALEGRNSIGPDDLPEIPAKRQFGFLAGIR
jgi:ATP-dependent Lon protease